MSCAEVGHTHADEERIVREFRRFLRANTKKRERHMVLGSRVTQRLSKELEFSVLVYVPKDEKQEEA